MFIIHLGLIFLSLFNNQIYIGVVEIISEKNSRQVEMRVKVYTNHLEEALRIETGEEIILSNSRQLAAKLPVVNKYILSHLEVSVNNQPLPINFLRLETIGELTYIYYRGNRTGKIENVCVDSDMLFTISPKQSNVVRIYIDGNERFIRLAADRLNGEISF